MPALACPLAASSMAVVMVIKFDFIVIVICLMFVGTQKHRNAEGKIALCLRVSVLDKIFISR